MSSVGHAPSKPQRLARGDWVAVVKRTAKEFLDDDCMGLAQQIAYSALLAFFPAVVALVGLLDLVGAYHALQTFLDPVAPKAVTDLIRSFQNDTGDNLTFGESASKNEMCIFNGIYYPSPDGSSITQNLP